MKTERESSRLSNVQFISESCDNQNWVQTVQGKHLQGTWQKVLAVYIPPASPRGAFSSRVSLDSYNLRRKWLGRDSLSPRRTAIPEEQRTLSISFLSAACTFPWWTECLENNSWAGEHTLLADREGHLPFCPGICIHSLHSWLSCAKQHASWLCF